MQLARKLRDICQFMDNLLGYNIDTVTTNFVVTLSRVTLDTIQLLKSLKPLVKV